MAKDKPKKPNRAMGKSKIVKSLLDEMVDWQEYNSIVSCFPDGLELREEIVKGMKDIEAIRERPLVCFLDNVINLKTKDPIGIDVRDDLPFAEMIDTIDSSEKKIDVFLVTPGGSAEQVAKFVNKLRPRFEEVGFILPFISMSAGTIFCLSGDELFMGSRAYIGPIDPQVPSRGGMYVPAQSIIALINNIQERGKSFFDRGLQPPWTDIQIINNLDSKEIGRAITASQYSIELVRGFLANYKFKAWNIHSSTGLPVTMEEKITRAAEIATELCDHTKWKTHARGITREVAKDELRLKIGHPEDIPGFDRAIRRLWALVYWVFERSPVIKILASEKFGYFRTTNSEGGK